MRDQCSLELNPNRGVKLSVNQIKTMWGFLDKLLTLQNLF